MRPPARNRAGSGKKSGEYLSLESGNRSPVKIISHRGGRGFGIDNTLEAMEKAVRAVHAECRMGELARGTGASAGESACPTGG